MPHVDWPLDNSSSSSSVCRSAINHRAIHFYRRAGCYSTLRQVRAGTIDLNLRIPLAHRDMISPLLSYATHVTRACV